MPPDILDNSGTGPEVALSEFPEGATLLRVYSADYDENSGWYVTASRPVTGFPAELS